VAHASSVQPAASCGRIFFFSGLDAYNQVREAARVKILRMLGKIDDAVSTGFFERTPAEQP
jgi:hypothetical protein